MGTDRIYSVIVPYGGVTVPPRFNLYIKYNTNIQPCDIKSSLQN